MKHIMMALVCALCIGGPLMATRTLRVQVPEPVLLIEHGRADGEPLSLWEFEAAWSFLHSICPPGVKALVWQVSGAALGKTDILARTAVVATWNVIINPDFNNQKTCRDIIAELRRQ